MVIIYDKCYYKVIKKIYCILLLEILLNKSMDIITLYYTIYKSIQY